MADKNISDSLKNRLLVPLTEAGEILGYKKQSSYNMKSRGKFPVPIKKINGKPMVRVSELLSFIDAE
jgi:predicted DNA-binding transcriptional regulator AlpA